MKPKRLISDSINDLDDLYTSRHYYSCIFVRRRKINGGSVIQIKLKNDKTKAMVLELYITLN